MYGCWSRLEGGDELGRCGRCLGWGGDWTFLAFGEGG